MITRRRKKFTQAEKPLHESAAFLIGKTTGRALKNSNKVLGSIGSSVKNSVRSFNKKMDDITSPYDKSSVVMDISPNNDENNTTSNNYLETFKDDANPELSSVVNEIQELADISGLSQAFAEMKIRTLKYNDDPELKQFISDTEQLDMQQQELVAQIFMQKLFDKSYFKEMLIPPTTKYQNVVKRVDHQQMSRELMSCLYEAYKEVGLIKNDYEYLNQISDEIAEPLATLLDFYSSPKSFSEHMKRLWKLQRIGFKAFKILRKANKIVENQQIGGAYFNPLQGQNH